MSEVKIIVNGAEVIVPKEDLTKGIEAGLYEIKNEGLKIYKAEDFETFTKNLANEEYKKGKAAGEEMLIKTAREKHALEFEGKTLDNFVDAYKNKLVAELGKEPSQKVKELTTDIEKLRANLGEWEGKYNSLNQTIEGERKKMRIDSLISNALPKQNTLLPTEDLALLFKSKYEIDLTENGHVVKKDGNVLKNATTLSELTINDVIADFIKPYSQQQQTAGRGASDSNGNNNVGSLEAFDNEMNTKGIKGYDYQVEMQKRIKDGTLKIK